MKNEIWTDITNYSDYQVSSFGRVKSKSRVVERGVGGCLPIKEVLLKQNIGTTGYFMVTIYSNKKQKTFKVHQLVAIGFLNHTPCGYDLVVNHKDFNKLNNNVENLEIVTQRENSNLKHKKSSSSHTGVFFANKKWRAVITYKKKNKHLGYFNSELEASNAYQKELNNTLIKKI